MLFNLKSEQVRECGHLNCSLIPHEGRKPSFGRDWGARNVRKNDVRGSRDMQHVQMLKDDGSAGSMMIVSFVMNTTPFTIVQLLQGGIRR